MNMNFDPNYWNWESSSSFDNFSFSNPKYDWDKLKKEGKVTETIEEKDGIKTITRYFISLDGNTKITNIESFFIIDDKKQRLKEIKKELEDALKKEDYKKASSLKKEEEKLLKPNRKK